MSATDLEAELRNLNPWTDMRWPDKCREAADIIASLREEVQRLTRQLGLQEDAGNEARTPWADIVAMEARAEAAEAMLSASALGGKADG